MSIFTIMPWQFNDYTEALLDTFLLVLLATPVIHFWIIKKYNNAHKEILKESEILLMEKFIRFGKERF